MCPRPRCRRSVGGSVVEARGVRVGFRVDVECGVGDGLPEVYTLTDPTTGKVRVFDSLEEAEEAAREELRRLSERGLNCAAHIMYYVWVYQHIKTITTA